VAPEAVESSMISFLRAKPTLGRSDFPGAWQAWPSDLKLHSLCCLCFVAALSLAVCVLPALVLFVLRASMRVVMRVLTRVLWRPVFVFVFPCDHAPA